MFRKGVYLFLFMLLGLIPDAFASHFMGGEIFWECLPNGNYRFIVRAYRECAGITYGNTISLDHNIPAANIPSSPTSIMLNLYPNSALGKTDISPQCFDSLNPSVFPHITCATTSQPNTGGVEEYYYTSDLSFPNGVMISGTPPASGYVFSISVCNRNDCQNIITASSYCAWLRAVMYSYNGQNVNPCWDNSPIFIERPSAVICTGYPFTYNPNATDKELDSLSYTWSQPYDTENAQITNYYPGFSYNSPLPGTSQNPNNVPATVNPYTGEISFTSFTSGAYVTVTKVTAFKCGVKIAEIFREMQVVLLPCGVNTPPDVTAPFINTSTGLYTEYVDTVYAGSVVNFGMSGQDFDQLNGGSLYQTLLLTASGNQFGTDYIDPFAGCLNPPCATLDPPPPLSGYMFTQTNFSWQTTCAHLQTSTGCGGVSNTYNFIIKVADDFCPAPAIKVSTITIVIKNAIMPNPEPRCTQVRDNGDVILSWIPPDTTVIPNTFNAYLIYSATNQSGPYTLIDSIFNYNTTSFSHHAANGQNMKRYYYMVTRSGCYGSFYSHSSDTISTIILDATQINSISANLEWNSPHNPALTTVMGPYHIQKQLPDASWETVDSTLNLSIIDTVTGCGKVVFRVTRTDSSGCITISSKDSALFQNANPPQLHCISVEPNGAITLSYSPPGDSLSQKFFNAYMVYGASSAFGPFNLVDSVFNINLTSATINALNGNTAPQYFYLVNRIACDGYFNSNPTDTLASIFLTPISINDSVNQLTWTPIHVPDLPTSTHTYDVYRKYPSGNWTRISQTMSLSTYDTLILCSDSIAYHIEIADNSGCSSVSCIKKGYYQDQTPPETPILDTVSIDTLTGHVTIGWIESTKDVAKYFIFFLENGVWNPLDSVEGFTHTLYVDSISTGDPCAVSKSYLLAAKDSCGNMSPMGTGNIHNTLHLEIDGIDPCADEIRLKWNNYINMKNAVGGYRIFMSENGSPYTVLATILPPAVGQDPPTNYTHKGFKQDSYYCYVVQAFNDDYTKTSTSCSACIFATKPNLPQFTYLRNVSVENNDRVHLKLFVDISSYATTYKIFRATEKAGPYELIYDLVPTGLPEMDYYDITSSVETNSFYYYFSVIDSCGIDVMHSDTSRTIFLNVTAQTDFTNILNWNEYEGWNWSFIKSYNIFRGIDGMVDPIPIATVPSGQITFVDDVSTYTTTQGKFRYFIEALEGNGLPPFADTSYSNRAYDVQPSLIHIPNAFSPKGYNSVFKPIGVFVDKSSYVLVVWNRLGQELFRTNDPNEGWNGRYKDEYVPGGVYIYYIKFITSDGQVFDKRSFVTVLK